jgi:outer membrane protein assembly factor BamB
MQAQPSIQRRWVQFNLRTLLLIIFVVAIALAVWRERKPETGYPTDWKPGKFSRKLNFAGGVPPRSRNIKWAASLGSQTYGSPVVSGGRVFIGTNNNGIRYLPRYLADEDFGVLLCFDVADGTFLWQATSPKVMRTDVRAPYQRMAEDYPLAGVSSTPVVAGERWRRSGRARSGHRLEVRHAEVAGRLCP